MPEPCPTPERLAAALSGRQPRADDADLAAHLTECPACQGQLESLAGGSSWLQAKARTHATTEPTACEPLRRVMHALESRAGGAPGEAPQPPKLDFLQPTDHPNLLGRFGPYEVIAHIASGGMGLVLKARDPALDRVVALKILPPALAANSLARARFVREARAAAAVVHEHVVPIYAVDEFAGLPYLVMQFVQGCSLAERIRATGPLRLEEILRIGAQTAAGLGAAHAQGLIHRDVKPGNILLENSVERVKLTDFGLARAADDTGLTRTGELAGTPEFMAPEQASNETVDHRSDLFSFGSVMYAMCTGDSPFQGTSIVAVIRQVCDKQLPPVHEVNQTIPRWLSDIIARLMAKAPDARFQSAQQVCELLERYLARVQHGDLSEMPLAQTSKSAVSRVSKLADETLSQAAPIWKSAIQQVWKPALLLAVVAALFFTLKNRRAVTPNSSPSPPTQQNRETKPSPSASIQEPFVVKTEAGKSVGSFTRIEDALAAAPPGAVIELCWNGTRDIDPISLPPKPLTLRAGRGFQPVWNNSSGAASALSANAALTLEEIRFLMTRARSFPNLGPYRPRTPPSGLALLAITNGPLRISRCTAEIRGGATHQAGIFLANVRACHIENAILWAITGKAVVWQQHSGGSIDPPSSTELGVSNCCTHAAEAFWLDFRDSARARLEIARSTFYGPGTFYVPASLAATNLEVNARQNIFHTPSVIFDARDPASPPLPRWLHWREQENLYKRDQRYIVGIAAPNGPAGLEEWNRWWNQTGANSRVVQLTFANGVSDLKPGPRLVPPEPDGFRIIDLNVVEGPPLERDQWQRFGAETDNVGSRSVK